MNKKHHSETPSQAGHAEKQGGDGRQQWQLGDPSCVLPAQADKNCHETSHPGQVSEATARECGKGSRELSFCTLKLPVAPELRR